MEQHLTQILSLEDKRIKSYLSMRDNLNDENFNPLFVAESIKVVLKLLNSNIKIHSILANIDFYTKNSDALKNREISNFYYADDNILKEIIGFRMHTGVIALAYKPEFAPIGALSNIIVGLNKIIDSENVGSIVRNSLAFGIDSIITDNGASSPFLRRAVRVSMGTVFSSKVHHTNDMISTLTILKDLGYKIISSEINDKSIPFSELNFPSKFVIIFGNEAHGIDSDILDISDYIIHIPMKNWVESINVASSSAVIFSRV